MGKLSIIATPIGNLEDITLRALRTLREADVIYAEDTRVTRKLCERHEIETPVKTYAADDRPGKIAEVVRRLEDGEHVAFVSDAGTPGLSDPGAGLVACVREELGEAAAIEAIPGPSALSAALSVAGVPADTFVFAGFLPHKKGRKTAVEALAAEPRTVAVYESPHRIVKTLDALTEYVPDRHVVLARELTKQFETVRSGSVAELAEQVRADANQQRGEIVLMLAPLCQKHKTQVPEHK